MSSAIYETVTFSCPIQGYHVYRNIWQRKENETLKCYHESDNNYDLFAITACRNAEFHQQIVGKLPLVLKNFCLIVQYTLLKVATGARRCGNSLCCKCKINQYKDK